MDCGGGGHRGARQIRFGHGSVIQTRKTQKK
jgi:hypothetical protein